LLINKYKPDQKKIYFEFSIPSPVSSIFIRALKEKKKLVYFLKYSKTYSKTITKIYKNLKSHKNI